ncbi:MAG: DUF1295 domain-containing protein [Bacteroidia bacterium]|nr:DUF1295 domain-containing protein [Bacteroidia bacterium]
MGISKNYNFIAIEFRSTVPLLLPHQITLFLLKSKPANKTSFYEKGYFSYTRSCNYFSNSFYCKGAGAV